MEEQLLHIAKKQLFWHRLTALLLLLILAGGAILAFRIYPAVKEIREQANALMTDVQTTAADLDKAAKSFQEIDFAQLAENIDEMVEQSGEAMTQTMQRVDQALQNVEDLDIGALNEGIARFNSVVEPLAKLFGR